MSEKQTGVTIHRMVCKNAQRILLDRGLLDPSDSIPDEVMDAYSEQELIALKKAFHELLYSPPNR